MRKIALVLILLASLAPAARAADTSAAFLKIGVGARPIAMGNAYTGVADDINALAWNPAGLSQLSQKEMGATSALMFGDIQYDFVGYAQPLTGKSGGNYGTLGLGAQYLSQGTIQGRDANRQVTGNFTGTDMALNLAYSRALNSEFRLGANMKYISSSIQTESASSFAVDLGGMYRTPVAGLTLGVAVQNIGPGMKFLDQTNPLPLSMAVGAGYHLGSGLMLAMDVKTLPNEKRTTVSLGTEYAAFSTLSLRAGYLIAAAAGTQAGSTAVTEQLGQMSGIGAGFGLKMGIYRLDYAFTPFGELGNVQRISLGARF